MKKNILILSTSPRKNGNSEMLAREFAKAVWPARKRSDASSMTMPTPSSEK